MVSVHHVSFFERLRFMEERRRQRFASPQIFILPLCQKIVTSADNGEVGEKCVLRQFRTLLYSYSTSSSSIPPQNN
jgi:hypothetical protein